MEQPVVAERDLRDPRDRRGRHDPGPSLRRAAARRDLRRMSAMPPILQVRGLARRFPGAAKPVFGNVSFAIDRGEFVCVIGHSGCGKTTILNILAGLDTATLGEVVM